MADHERANEPNQKVVMHVMLLLTLVCDVPVLGPQRIHRDQTSGKNQLIPCTAVQLFYLTCLPHASVWTGTVTTVGMNRHSTTLD